MREHGKYINVYEQVRHNTDTAKTCYELIRCKCFDNVSIDIYSYALSFVSKVLADEGLPYE